MSKIFSKKTLLQFGVPLLVVLKFIYSVFSQGQNFIIEGLQLILFITIWNYRVGIFTKENLKKFGLPAVAMLIFAYRSTQYRYIDVTSALLMIFTFLWLLIGAARYLKD